MSEIKATKNFYDHVFTPSDAALKAALQIGAAKFMISDFARFC